ncbi:MAG: hypothetical protein AB7D39_20950 [Pseudodesulfovibrio sp.]|uniref:hypothetical protein n=1 Tax=Pseudodesulfovibrio sp. TaxID=2035812 RepID=UPI003D0ECB66
MLQDALVSLLETGLADLAMDRPGRALGAPAVFRAALPSASDDEEAFPFVVVRWLEGEDYEADESMETFALIIGVYGEEDGDGHAASVAEQWSMVAASSIRRLLHGNQTLAGKFSLRFPVNSRKPTPEHQQERYHLVTITTKWSAPAPEPLLEA